MKYKVIPFTGSLDQNKNVTSVHVASQLEDVITKNSALGWEYVRLESVSTWVAPDNGCFGIIGGKPGYTTTCQVIVFERMT